MKRLVLTLAAGAFGSLMALPIANAQTARDMNNDANVISQDHAAIQTDKQEKREDKANGRFGAAANEQAEIMERRAAMRDRKNDLKGDLANRYGDEDASGRPYNRDNFHNND